MQIHLWGSIKLSKTSINQKQIAQHVKEMNRHPQNPKGGHEAKHPDIIHHQTNETFGTELLNNNNYKPPINDWERMQILEKLLWKTRK